MKSSILKLAIISSLSLTIASSAFAHGNPPSQYFEYKGYILCYDPANPNPFEFMWRKEVYEWSDVDRLKRECRAEGGIPADHTK